MSTSRRFESPIWDEADRDIPLEDYISHLLRRSAFPGIRIEHIQETLTVERAELADLDREISNVRSTLDALKEKKRGIDHLIHEHAQLLTPLRRFPDDVLREIFVACLPAEHNAVMDIREAPLLLGRVCSRWRALAYSTPRLWNTLHVCSFAPPLADSTTFWIPDAQRKWIMDDFERLFRVHYAAVREWIGRSGALPLSLSINLRNAGIPTHLNRLVLGYFDVMFACSERWRSLEICVPHTVCTALSPSLRSLSFPRLEYVHVMFPNGGGYQLEAWKNSNILRAPKLHALRLSRLPDPPSSLQIDWSRFTHIVLRPMPPTNSGSGKLSLKDAFELLRICTRIEHCGFAVLDAQSATSPRGTLPLPMLSSLIIVDEAMQLDTLIHLLDVPSLRSITYFTSIPPQARPTSPLVSLLELTNGRVASLTTSLHFFTLKDLVACFSLLPSLTSLTNAKSSWPDVESHQRRWAEEMMMMAVPYTQTVMKSILSLLLPASTNLLTPHSQCLCPNLHSLTLTDSQNLRDSDALSFILHRLAAARRPTPGAGVVRLKNVRIAFDGAKTVDLSAHLQSFFDEGFDFDLAVSYPQPPAPHADVRPRSPRGLEYGTFDPRLGLVVPARLPPVVPRPILRSMI